MGRPTNMICDITHTLEANPGCVSVQLCILWIQDTQLWCSKPEASCAHTLRLDFTVKKEKRYGLFHQVESIDALLKILLWRLYLFFWTNRYKSMFKQTSCLCFNTGESLSAALLFSSVSIFCFFILPRHISDLFWLVEH